MPTEVKEEEKGEKCRRIEQYFQQQLKKKKKHQEIERRAQFLQLKSAI